MKNDNFRYEFKYFCHESTLFLQNNQIGMLLKKDSHVTDSGYYTIRSLYFDDFYNSYYYQNENGVDPRKKYRIRIYNDSDEIIFLECKKKECGMTQKTSCLLTLDDYYKIINHNFSISDYQNNPLITDFLINITSRLLRPSIIVEYDRVPYTYKDGNVRITFDKNIRTSENLGKFLDKRIETRPIMPKNFHILEVKYTDYLPEFIKTALQTNNLYRTTFSKYYLCKKFSIGGQFL